MLGDGIDLSIQLGINAPFERSYLMGMRWFNWIGILMLIFFLVIHEPIFLNIWYNFNIVWVVALATYVIIAVWLALREGSSSEED